MTIETKYNVGDEVWHYEYSKPQSSIVTDIVASVHGEKQSIEYELKDTRGSVYERDLFSSKEELHNHLRDQALAKVDALFIEAVAE